MDSTPWILLLSLLSVLATSSDYQGGPLTSLSQCHDSPPNLALCLAGHARTFSERSIVDGLLKNFVHAFGANVTTFLYLKLQDHSTKGKDRAENLGATDSFSHVEDVREAAERLPNLASLSIIEEDVVFRHPPCGQSREFEGNNSNGFAWRQIETWQMLVGQLYNQHWCGQAIEQYERKTGIAFDVVLKSRPDVTFVGPSPPFCAFDYASRACSARDWLFMLPGSVAVRALKRGYEEFLQCRTIMNRNRTKIAEIIVRAAGMGKELKDGMSRPDSKCMGHCGKNCTACKRLDTPLRLIRRKGIPSGSLPGAIPKQCGF